MLKQFSLYMLLGLVAWLATTFLNSFQSFQISIIGRATVYFLIGLLVALIRHYPNRWHLAFLAPLFLFDFLSIYYNENLFPVIFPFSTITSAICFLFFISLISVPGILKKLIISFDFAICVGSFFFLFLPSLIFKCEIESKEKLTIANFELEGVNCKSIKLNQNEQRVSLLAFWHTRCRSCIESFPYIEQLVKKYENNNSVNIGIVASSKMDSLQVVKDFIIKNKVEIPCYFTNSSGLLKSAGVIAFPTHVIINQENKIVLKHIGFSKDSKQVFVSEMSNFIENELSGKN